MTLHDLCGHVIHHPASRGFSFSLQAFPQILSRPPNGHKLIKCGRYIKVVNWPTIINLHSNQSTHAISNNTGLWLVIGHLGWLSYKKQLSTWSVAKCTFHGRGKMSQSSLTVSIYWSKEGCHSCIAKGILIMFWLNYLHLLLTVIKTASIQAVLYDCDSSVCFH